MGGERGGVVGWIERTVGVVLCGWGERAWGGDRGWRAFRVGRTALTGGHYGGRHTIVGLGRGGGRAALLCCRPQGGMRGEVRRVHPQSVSPIMSQNTLIKSGAGAHIPSSETNCCRHGKTWY